MREFGMEQKATQAGKDVGRAFQLFLRAVRAFQTQGRRSTGATRAAAEAHQALSQVLDQVGRLSVSVHEDRVLYEEQIVLFEPPSPEALSYVLHQDGVRHLDLARGLEPFELEILITAAANAGRATSIGDDAGTLLWSQDLAHIRCRLDEPDDPALEEDVDRLLGSLYGGSGVGDPARALADNLAGVDPSAPGPHPIERLQAAPAYAQQLASQAAQEDQETTLLRAVAAGNDALSTELGEGDVDGILATLLQMVDGAIHAGDLQTATAIIARTRNAPLSQERIWLWTQEICSEAHRREITARYRDAQTEDSAKPLFELFRALGPSAIPLTLGVLPIVVDSGQRRRFSRLALELGIEGLEPVRALLSNDLIPVVQEGMYLLSQIGTPEAHAMLDRFVSDPKPEIRAALAEVADQLHESVALSIAARFLNDGYLKARIGGARSLSRIPSPQAAKLIEDAVTHPTFEDASFEVKVAFLESYAIRNQLRSLLLLSKHMKRAEGLLVRRELEDLGVASALAMSFVPTQRSVEFLKAACVVRNKRLREAAREVLQRLKEREK